MSNKPYLLALNRIYGVGPRTILSLIKRWPNLAELFNASQAQLLAHGLSTTLAQHIINADLSAVESDLNWEQASGNHHLITFEDDNYPALLKEIYDPPVILYAKGNLSAFNQPNIAMVGTRKPSVTGEETAFRFAFELASQHLTIVSGLARGIDGCAHRGALAAQGATVAVMATGIDNIYPRMHQKLAENISERGLLITEFPLKITPSARHFPQRNRIISGLSLATLVVEAAIKSGSLITARLAVEQNRDVLAIPGSIYNPQSQGCHYLVQQGAKLVTMSAEVIDELRLTINSSPLTSQHGQQPLPLLASINQNLVKYIGYEVTTVDKICQRSQLSIEQVISLLAELELQGIVQAVMGGYIRCSEYSR